MQYQHHRGLTIQQHMKEPVSMILQHLKVINKLYLKELIYFQILINHGVHPSLLTNFQHQVIHCKLKLKIEYPPPYQRVFWNFRKAKCDSIKKAFKSVNLDLLFSYKDVHQQVSIFNDALINIFTNFVPKKLVTNDDKDPP